MSAPDLTEEVIGFRTWLLRDGKLLPANDCLPAWKLGTNEAECHSEYFGAMQEHAAPDVDCDCGFYAWHSIEEAQRRYWTTESVLGAVKAWGLVMLHPDGFRAQFVEPVAFAYDDTYQLGQHRRAGEFCREHGLRYMPMEELGEFAEGYGALIPESMRPEPKPSKFTINIGASYISPNVNLANFYFQSGGSLQVVPQSPLVPSTDELLALAGILLSADDLRSRITEGIDDAVLRRLGL